MGVISVKTLGGETFKLKYVKGETILSCLQRNNLPVNAVCGGAGKCHKCKIRVLPKKIGADTSTVNRPGELVLACQTILNEDIEIEFLQSSSVSSSVITQLGYEPPIEYNPSARKIFLEIRIQDYRDVKNNEEKIVEELKAKGVKITGFSPGIKDTLMPLFDTSKGRLTVTLRDGEIIHVESGDKTRSHYGLALDIGTSQLSLFLVDLASGGNLDFISEVNLQTAYGGDVISRLSFIMKHPINLQNVRETSFKQICAMINKIILKNKLNPSNIYEAVVVGNTLMMHIFHGADPSGLAKHPYTSSMKQAKNANARTYNLGVNKLANIYSPPNISGYIGADIAAGIIASGIYKPGENCLLIDIGTNTEMILRCNNRFYGCSTPSGPAFEGGQLKHGMRADKGAIESVFIDPDNYDVKFRTVGGAEPVGICGSGIIDAIMEFRKVGAIEADGRIDSRHELTATIDSGKHLILTYKVNGEPISISQDDVREIQKAKAAIQAGYLALLNYSECGLDQLEGVIIAGSFGLHINLDSGRGLGIIPMVGEDKIKYLGNLAGSGARLILKNVGTRSICESLPSKVEYVELGQLKIFQDLWLKSLNIK